MRILVISHNFPHLRDLNCGIFVARQLVEMHRLGADITVLVPIIWTPEFISHFRRYRDYGSTRHLVQYDGLSSVVVPFLRPPGRFFYRWDGLSLFGASKRVVKKLHREKQFDVIFGRGLFPEADLAARLSPFLKIPAVGLGMGTDVNVFPDYSKTIYKHFVWIVNSLDFTLATGRGVADRIDAVSNKRTLVVHGVVDLDKFAPVTDKAAVRKELSMPLEGLIVLFVGHLYKLKGVYELVEAFSRAKKVFPNLILKICGHGMERDGLEKLAKELYVSESVEFVGDVEPDEVPKWMQASDVFILSSHNEGMPNAVMEAMACGLPVVATAVGGLPDTIGNCQGAILVKPRDIDELASSILKVARDKQLRQRMGMAARKIARERFGVRRTAQMVLDCLEKVIRKA